MLRVFSVLLCGAVCSGCMIQDLFETEQIHTERVSVKAGRSFDVATISIPWRGKAYGYMKVETRKIYPSEPIYWFTFDIEVDSTGNKARYVVQEQRPFGRDEAKHPYSWTLEQDRSYVERVIELEPGYRLNQLQISRVKGLKVVTRVAELEDKPDEYEVLIRVSNGKSWLYTIRESGF